MIVNSGNSVIHWEVGFLLYFLQLYINYIYHAWPRWAWSYTVGPQLYLRRVTSRVIVHRLICACLQQSRHIPGSYTLSCQYKRLFLLRQAVEHLQSGVKPAGFRPFGPRIAAARSGVERPSCTDEPAEDLSFSEHRPPWGGPHACSPSLTSKRRMASRTVTNVPW